MQVGARVAGVIIVVSVAGGALAQPLLPVEARAQRIISENCGACHGQARMSDLDLRQIQTILKGGKRGPGTGPGKSAASLLYRAIAQTGDLKMPPGKSPLPPADVETIRQWIDAGAKWPTTTTTPPPPPWWRS